MRSPLPACLCFLASMISLTAAEPPWTPLPPLPDPEGFAGAFAGVVANQLVVAGGTNFPDKRPWEGGTKTWYDRVFVLDQPQGAWRESGKLPRPNGYGVSLTTPEGLLLLGGGNATMHFREVWRVVPAPGKEGGLCYKPMPPLPSPCAFMAGVVAGRTVYVVGGIETPGSTSAMNTCWALDLNQADAAWKIHPPCPGPARILATLAADDRFVYVFSGAALKIGPDGKAERTWLKDAWRFSPEGGWEALADLPRVAVAAPSPAPKQGGKFLILGGDDGALVNFEPKEKHPGFPRDVLAYDPGANTWSRQEPTLPFSLVTTPLVEWQRHLVVPGGEARPGKRSPEVWWK